MGALVLRPKSLDPVTPAAVIFDLDGTLLDTLEDLASSMNRALEGLGHPPHPIDAYRVFVGDGVKMLARRALPDGARDEETVARAVRSMKEIYGAAWNVKTRPYDGIPELLDSIGERGLPIAVLSNKPHDLTRIAVGAYFDLDRFAAVYGARDGIPGKPDPTSAIALAAELGVAPAECLYFGDTNTDMRTAVSAGMHAVGVTWGFREEAELREAGAMTILHHPEEAGSFL